MKITDYSRSSPGVTLGTAANANAIGGVSANSPAVAGTILVATSSNAAVWRDALSFGSNTNDVSSVGTMGASPSNTRADHVHRGVTSLAHTSNTFSGPVTLIAQGPIGITTPSTGTFALSATGVPTGPAGGDLAGTYPNPTVDATHSGSTHTASMVPYLIASGETYTVPINKQALFEMVIDNQGTLVVDGYLIMVT